MRLPPDGNTVRQDAHRGREHVHFIVVAAGHPELASVGGDVTHVGTPASWDTPRLNDPARGEVDHTDRSRTVAAAGGRVPASVRHVEFRAVATRIQSVRPRGCLDEPDTAERARI